jgi:hypothetical protein
LALLAVGELLGDGSLFSPLEALGPWFVDRLPGPLLLTERASGEALAGTWMIVTHFGSMFVGSAQSSDSELFCEVLVVAGPGAGLLWTAVNASTPRPVPRVVEVSTARILVRMVCLRKSSCSEADPDGVEPTPRNGEAADKAANDGFAHR